VKSKLVISVQRQSYQQLQSNPFEGSIEFSVIPERTQSLHWKSSQETHDEEKPNKSLLSLIKKKESIAIRRRGKKKATLLSPPQSHRY
jgi:hypothetical protein